MSKALRHMTPPERAAAIARRLKEERGGLGYLAAVDASKKASGAKMSDGIRGG